MSDSILKIFRGQVDLREEIETAYHELFEYVEKLYGERRGSLGDDFLSHVIRQEDQGVLSRQEAMDLIVLTLEASTDNTAHQMALITSLFLENTEAWKDLVAHPELIENAIDEAIRLRPRSISNSRVALEDLEWEGFDIPKGTEFFLSVLAANRDPSVFARPDEFNIRRKRPTAHQMFGGGMTMCLGSTLARMEIQEYLSAIIDRYPNLAATKPTSYRFIPPVVAETAGVHVVLKP